MFVRPNSIRLAAASVELAEEPVAAFHERDDLYSVWAFSRPLALPLGVFASWPILKMRKMNK
jgi:hypothetical protein